MSIWLALLLGVVQGLCEFLPVSSSGHLLLLSKLFGVDGNAGGAFFTVMLHVATLIAVVIVYRKTLWELIRHPIQKTVGYIILATVPTVLIALLFKKVEPFSSFYASAEGGSLLGVSFLLTALLLTLCDWAASLPRRKTPLKEMRLPQAVAVGCMQAVGVLPGVSRSGSTIAGALFSGLDRKAAADFSFLLSIPAILGGAVLEVKDVIEAGSIGVSIPALLVGMAAAGVTGYFAVRFMLRLITKRRLWGFAVYTGLLGVAVIVMQLLNVL